MWIVKALLDPTAIILLALLIALYIFHRVMTAREARAKALGKEGILMFTLDSGRAKATISQQGAELTSLRKSDGTEVMWRVDPAFWDRQAPILFPLVGRVAGDHYTYKGQTYALGIHGFARDRRFEVVDQTRDSLWLELHDDDVTREVYPFAFRLRVGYVLDGTTLDVCFEVLNPSETEPLLFSIGAHPGFACRLSETELVFDTDRIEVRRVEGPDNLLGYEREVMTLPGGRLRLSPALFENDAMVLDDPGERVGIADAGQPPRIWVRYPNFPTLGIWSQRGDAPFICIEPWFGHVDPIDSDGTLENKAGIITLAPGCTFECMHSIELV